MDVLIFVFISCRYIRKVYTINIDAYTKDPFKNVVLT